MIPSVSFEPVSHTYTTTAGIKLPSVTTIINHGASAYSGIPPWVLKRAGEFGTAVHSYIEQVVKSEQSFQAPPLKDPHPKIHNASSAFDKWYQEKRRLHQHLAWEHQEILVHSPTYQYAGTVDALLKLDDKLWMIDFKTSNEFKMPQYGQQLAAYRHCIRELGYGDPDECVLVRLDKKDGYWVENTLLPEQLDQHWDEFLEKLNAYRSAHPVAASGDSAP